MQPEKNTAIDAFMALLAERPWNEVSLDAIAERAGLAQSDLREAYDGRLDIFGAFMRRTDKDVLEGIDPHMAGEAARERLFDILFSRIEALGPYKAALRNLASAVRGDPLLALELNRMATVAMGWMLAAAKIRATGPMGAVRAQGLALVWLRVLQVWLGEDDPTAPRTMAELDRQLRRSERAAIRLDRLCDFVRRCRDSGEPRPYTPPPPSSPADVVEAHPS